MPITPGCHPSPASTMAGASWSRDDSTRSIAWAKICSHSARRCWLAASSCAAIASASAGSPVVSNFTATPASPRRPAAFRRGAGITRLGVDDRHGWGQRWAGRMVIHDDHVLLPLTRPRDLAGRSDPAVHRDNQVPSRLREPVQRGIVEPVTFGEPGGDVETYFAPQRLQPAQQNTGGGDAIGVVVAIDGNRLMRAE